MTSVNVHTECHGIYISNNFILPRRQSISTPSDPLCEKKIHVFYFKKWGILWQTVDEVAEMKNKGTFKRAIKFKDNITNNTNNSKQANRRFIRKSNCHLFHLQGYQIQAWLGENIQPEKWGGFSCLVC